MYRICVLCGWGRKECLENVKFFSIPKEAGLQKLEWMHVLAGKRKNGFKKVDSVCSIHFQTNRPSSDPTHVDFAPNQYLERKTVPQSLRESCLLHFSVETPEVMERRKARLNALHMRTKALREIQKEPSDAWLKRKRERDEKRKQRRASGSSSEDAWRKAGPSIRAVESTIHNSVPKNHTKAEDEHVDVHEEEDEHIDVEEHVFDEEPEVEMYYDDSGSILDVEHEEEVIAEDEPQSYRRSVVDEHDVKQPLARLAATSNRMAPHRQYYISQAQQQRRTTSYRYQTEKRIVYVQKPM